MDLKEFQKGGLKTQRLKLRSLTLMDATDMFEYTSYPPNSVFLSWEPHRTVEEDKRFIRETLLKYEKGEELLFGIQLKNKLIGTVRIYNFNWGKQEAEVSCILNQNYTGQGYMYEVYQYIFRELHENFFINRMVHCVDKNNLGSYKLIQKFHVISEEPMQYILKNKQVTWLRVIIDIREEV